MNRARFRLRITALAGMVAVLCFTTICIFVEVQFPGNDIYSLSESIYRLEKRQKLLEESIAASQRTVALMEKSAASSDYKGNKDIVSFRSKNTSLEKPKSSALAAPRRIISDNEPPLQTQLMNSFELVGGFQRSSNVSALPAKLFSETDLNVSLST